MSQYRSVKSIYLLFLFIICISATSCHSTQRTGKRNNFSFGVIADCQYCNVVSTGVRKYSISDHKLEECVKNLNKMDLSYTIHLGDFIDKDWSSFDTVVPIFDLLQMPKYHVLGNHDYSVEDEKKPFVVQRLNMPSEYYDFKVYGWRFIVLNGNDISFHSYPKDSEEYQFAASYYEENQISSPKWNGAIGKTQLLWLKEKLEQATKSDENVILYCHFPVFPEDIHNLWNAEEVINTIEAYPCVKAYMNGHNHSGNYGIKNSVHYVTFKGMVDTEQTSYGVVKVSREQLQIIGFGREGNRTLTIK